jgi:NAD-dependent SIR2 family protein deacetylase
LLSEDEQLAKGHNPELRLVTKNIEELHAKVSESHLHLLHPNLNKVTRRPWGCARICHCRQAAWHQIPAMVNAELEPKANHKK